MKLQCIRGVMVFETTCKLNSRMSDFLPSRIKKSEIETLILHILTL